MTTIHQLFDLAKMVKSERLNQELTQAELAAHAGVSRRWLIGFEQGDIEDARFGNIMKVLAVLGIQLNAIKTSQEPESRRPITAKDIQALNPNNWPYLTMSTLLDTQLPDGLKSQSALEKLRAKNLTLVDEIAAELAKLQPHSDEADND